MTDEIRAYIDTKFKVFDDYFHVPEHVESELNEVRARAYAIGENCADEMEFETRFASQLADDYNSLFARCTPRSVKMTKEQKKHSAKLAAELAYGTSSKGKMAMRAAADIVKEAADTARVEAVEELIARRREDMIDRGTFDDYTIARNTVDDALRGVKALKGLFGRKK